MSVWISDEKLLIFASLISPSKFVKNTPLRVVFFNSLLGVSSGDETLRLMFDILRKPLSKNRGGDNLHNLHYTNNASYKELVTFKLNTSELQLFFFSVKTL